MRLAQDHERRPGAHAAERARFLVLPALGALLVATLVGPAPAAAGTTVCVGSGPGCHATLQEGVDAAVDGGFVRVLPGTYAGGVRLTRSVRVSGAGAGLTVVRGGGPVITISTPGPSRPLVEISGMTITGGHNRGGEDGVEAVGGGLLLTPAADGGVGAIVTLREVLVTRNRSEPRRTSASPSGVQCPSGRDCPYAYAGGGGIASFGDLTLLRSRVTDNLAGGRASDAVGGGIRSELGSLTIDSSTIAGNRAAPTAIGRYAEGGGIFVASGDLTMRHSSVKGNRVDLVTRWASLPDGSPVRAVANGGGIHVGGEGHVQVDHSAINENAIDVVDLLGRPLAFDSALLVDGPRLTMRHSQLSGNTLRLRSAGNDESEPAGTVAELDGPTTISDTRVERNHVDVVSRAGDANANGGLAFFNFYSASASLTRVLVQDNTVVARSRSGSTLAFAGGVWNASTLTITDSTIRRNAVAARGVGATAFGGGIANQAFDDPPVDLTLIGTRVRRNSATTGPGGSAEGGGVYTRFPLTRRDTTIVRNQPDDCSGCDASTARVGPDPLGSLAERMGQAAGRRPLGRAAR